MARVKVYLRVARTHRGYRAAARTSRASLEPLRRDSYGQAPYPTAAFAVVLDIPDEIFDRAEQVLAEVQVAESDAQIAAEVDRGEA